MTDYQQAFNRPYDTTQNLKGGDSYYNYLPNEQRIIAIPGLIILNGTSVVPDPDNEGFFTANLTPNTNNEGFFQ